MTDMASPGAGASVVMATCSDERHPPHNALDEDERSFWVTTGLFPQEIVVKFVNREKTYNELLISIAEYEKRNDNLYKECAKL